MCLTEKNGDPENKKDYVPGKIIYGFFSAVLILLGIILTFMIEINRDIGSVTESLKHKPDEAEVIELIRQEIDREFYGGGG